MKNGLFISLTFENPIYIVYYNKKIYCNEISSTKSGSSIVGHMNEFFEKESIKLESLEFVSIDIGPGSFTGIRISVAVIQGLFFQREVKAIPLLSTDILVHSYKYDLKNSQGNLVVLKRARANAAYISIYHNWRRTFGPEMLNLKDLLKKIENYNTFLCKESEYFLKKLNLNGHVIDQKILPEAVYDLILSKWNEDVSIKDLKPLYIQKPLAVENWEKRHSIQIEKDIYE